MNDFIKMLLTQARGTYTFKSLKNPETGDPLTVEIRRVSLVDLVTSGAIPYDLIEGAAAKGGTSEKAARQAALEMAGMATNAEDMAGQMLAMVRMGIKVINLGCGSLSGQIYATEGECPHDAAGQRTGLLYIDLGDDFESLIEAIKTLSLSQEGGAEKAREFPGKRASAEVDRPDLPPVADPSVGAPGVSEVGSGGPGPRHGDPAEG